MAKELVLNVDFDITKAEAKQRKLNAEWEKGKIKLNNIKSEIEKIDKQIEDARNNHEKTSNNTEIAKIDKQIEIARENRKKASAEAESFAKRRDRAEAQLHDILSRNGGYEPKRGIDKTKFKELEKEANNAQSLYEQAKKNEQKSNDLIDKYISKQEKLNEQIEKNEQKNNDLIDKYISKQEKLNAQYELQSANLNVIGLKIKDLYGKPPEDGGDTSDKKKGVFSRLFSKLKDSTEDFRTSVSESLENAEEYTDSFKSSNAELKHNDNFLQKINKRISSILKQVLFFRVVRKTLYGLLGFFSSSVKSFDTLQKCINQIKGNMQIIGSVLFVQIKPVVEWLLNSVQSISALIAAGLANTTGQSVDEMKKLAQETENAGKAANKAVAGFDELNIINNREQTDYSGIDAIKESADAGIFERLLAPFKDIDFDNLIAGFNNLCVALQPFTGFIWDGLCFLHEGVLVPLAEWTIEEGLPGFLQLLTDMANSQDWNKIKESALKLWEALKYFGGIIGDGLLWFWGNCLVPFAAWAGENDLIPKVLDLIASAIDLLGTVIEICRPTFEFLITEILLPLGRILGDMLIDLLNRLTQTLKNFTAWAKDNPEKVRTIANIILGFLAGLWIYNTTKKIINFLSELTNRFVLFGKGLNTSTLAIGLLTAAALLWITQWDKIKDCWDDMSGWQKAIAIVLGLAAAFAVLKIAATGAIGAAGIIAGLTALGLGAGILWAGGAFAQKASATAFDTGNIDFNSSQFTKIPMCASGAVLPANHPFLAVVGDQKNGTNIEAPLSMIEEATARAVHNALLTQNSQLAGQNLTVIMQVDRTELGRLVYRLNEEETQRVGVKLGGVRHGYNS